MEFKKLFITSGFVALALIAASIFSLSAKSHDDIDEEVKVGASIEDAKWFMVDRFEGFQTKADATKITNGGNPNGQNTIINDGDRISIRDLGFEHFTTGTASTTASAIQSLHTFKKRDGENIMIRTHGTFVEYLERGNNTWETVSTTYTSGKKFGFSDFNINTDLQSYVYFGNGTDSGVRWTGNHTMTNGAYAGGAGSINVDDTSGFPSSGNIIYCDTSVAYSSKTATTFVVGASAHSCDDNRGVAEALETQSSAPVGNIYLAKDNRLFIAGIASSTQMVMFSAYGDATSWAENLLVDGTDAAAGYFNLGEGGGAVTGMSMDENSIYFFKKSIIYKATLTDTLYTILPLKPFDGKSQTTGAESSDSIFVGGNGVIFVTPDRQIMSLNRVDGIDYPQVVPISDPIRPTIEAARFTSSTGITFGDNSFIAGKSSSSVVNNDSVFVWNNRLRTWESPIVGWNVGAWTIYDDGTGAELYFGDAITPNVYKVTSIPLDDVYSVTANWRSKQFDFGMPYSQKEIDNVFIEGYIADNTTLSISLLLDENGYTQTYTTDFVGTETTYLYQDIEYNLFGFHPFGFERFGSNADQSGKKKFRVYLNKNLRRVPFYNAQIEFASDGENQQWEVTKFGFSVREFSQPEDRDLYRNFQ